MEGTAAPVLGYWTCAGCSQRIAHGTTHVCPSLGSYTTPPVTHSRNERSPVITTLSDEDIERIARKLAAVLLEQNRVNIFAGDNSPLD